MSPAITVVVPVYNRDEQLRRALVSIQRQTLADFECIVVDDGSTIPIAPLVESLGDDRFVYARNAKNGGPYNARVHGYRLMRGEFLVGLDSDEEAYPWMLAQAVNHLRREPEVDGVAGMHLRTANGRLFVRIPGGCKVVTPAEFVRLPPIPDCIGAVRRVVVDEWLQKRDDYFALESHQWLTFHLKHSMLFVEEPWTRFHDDGTNRVSATIDPRHADDYVKFLDEHAAYVSGGPCEVLDRLLEDGWFLLWRSGRHEDARRFAQALEERGLSRVQTIRRRARQKAQRLLRGDDLVFHVP
jgi:glycosyltransferase involved in cell wall biosynthesis